MYFRLSLSYKVERNIWEFSERPQSNLRETWTRKITSESSRQKRTDADCDPLSSWKSQELYIPTFNIALILLLVSFYLYWYIAREVGNYPVINYEALIKLTIIPVPLFPVARWWLGPCPVIAQSLSQSPALGTWCQLGGKFSPPTSPQIEAR